MDPTEAWRLAAEEWADLEAAAELLSETKTTMLAQITAQMEGGSHAACERAAKCSPRWSEFIAEMTEAKDKARRAKIRVDHKKMLREDAMNAEWSRRQEMRLTRG